jgi:hypothetical protein
LFEVIVQVRFVVGEDVEVVIVEAFSVDNARCVRIQSLEGDRSFEPVRSGTVLVHVDRVQDRFEVDLGSRRFSAERVERVASLDVAEDCGDRVRLSTGHVFEVEIEGCEGFRCSGLFDRSRFAASGLEVRVLSILGATVCDRCGGKGGGKCLLGVHAVRMLPTLIYFTTI